MPNEPLTSLQRVLTSLGHQEPDRVPLMLLLTMHGAKELGLSIKDYFSRPEYMVEGQLRLRRKYGQDCYYTLAHAPLENVAWGGEVIFAEDGPPNSGQPQIKAEDIANLEVPHVRDAPGLQQVLTFTRNLSEQVAGDAPLIGVVMSPFSLPVMQMGFNHYLDLMLEQPERFERLMQLNEEFCVEWANAQLDAGANAICYFDPVSSPTIVPRDLYLRTGFQIAQRTLARIKGPTVTHFASGRTLPVLDDLPQTGTFGIGVSTEEDLAELKRVATGRITILGNLNGITMRRWTAAEAEREVKAAIAAAGRGGGFLLSDNHGEIPFQVGEETLLAIGEAVRRWGTYPLRWIEDGH
jgi:uroporphyrinogen decarboxylase